MMKISVLSLTMSIAAVGLAACGFQPVYAPSVSAEAGPIEIDQIDGRAGHELRKALLIETAAGLPGAPQGGRMNVSLKEQVIETGFRSDGSTSRATLRLVADYVIDLGDDAKSGREAAEVSINVPNAIFQDITNQTEARELAARELARLITQQLIFELNPAP